MAVDLVVQPLGDREEVGVTADHRPPDRNVEVFDVTDQALLAALTGMAAEVMQAMSLRLAAVDIAETAAGEFKVLEVNDGITLEHYLRQGFKEVYNVAGADGTGRDDRRILQPGV